MGSGLGSFAICGPSLTHSLPSSVHSHTLASRHSTRIVRSLGNNPVAVLATLFLLSYAKLLRSIINPLYVTFLDYPSDTEAVWLVDGNINYLKGKLRFRSARDRRSGAQRATSVTLVTMVEKQRDTSTREKVQHTYLYLLHTYDITIGKFIYVHRPGHMYTMCY